MLTIVVALKAEARPLVSHFGMTAEKSGCRLQTYRSPRVRLAVSGVGAAAARAATEFATRGTDHPSPCLNVGIAGHGSLALGTPLLVHKVTDRETGTTHYPAFPFRPPCATTALVTASAVETVYADPCAYDMEGSGFFTAGVHAAGAELAHSLKIVSDNPLEPPEFVSRHSIEALLEEQLDLIERVVSMLSECAELAAARRRDPPEYAAILERWHFTSTQRHQLRRLLQRCHALVPGEFEQVARSLLQRTALRSAREVITFLQRRIDSLPFSLS